MRISDWSSYVCSSDLQPEGERLERFRALVISRRAIAHHRVGPHLALVGERDREDIVAAAIRTERVGAEGRLSAGPAAAAGQPDRGEVVQRPGHQAAPHRAEVRERCGISHGRTSFRVSIFESLVWRSEEHTSELQSLMRISYAVFCLKTKKQNH